MSSSFQDRRWNRQIFLFHLRCLLSRNWRTSWICFHLPGSRNPHLIAARMTKPCEHGSLFAQKLPWLNLLIHLTEASFSSLPGQVHVLVRRSLRRCLGDLKSEVTEGQNMVMTSRWWEICILQLPELMTESSKPSTDLTGKQQASPSRGLVCTHSAISLSKLPSGGSETSLRQLDASELFLERAAMSRVASLRRNARLGQ